MQPRLFISHASEDSATADRIVSYLENKGVRCWIAGRDIPPQSIYAEAITAAMQECSVCVVLLSASANTSDAIKRELELASHYRKPFIPIRLDGSEPGPGLDYYLRNAQWIEYRRDGERALDRIVQHMRGSAKASTPRSAPAPIAPRSSGAMAPVLIGVVVALAIVGGGYYFFRPQPTARAPETTIAAQAPAIDTTTADSPAPPLSDPAPPPAAPPRVEPDDTAEREARERAQARERAAASEAEAEARRVAEARRYGRVWHETEGGGDWRGTWIRRGDSRTFDAYWQRVGSRQRSDAAVLEMRIRGDAVTISRTQERGVCTYTGTLSADGASAQGAYSCPWDRPGTTNAWSATITQ